MRLGSDFDAVVARFSPDPNIPLLLAVSGGSDSLALLVLVSRWASVSGRKLHIATVDHGLRSEAAEEALFVQRLATSLGHTHATLNWQTPRASQNAARQARYQLLCEEAHRIHAHVILLGHTFDDVVETALIRRSRGVRAAQIAGPSLTAPAPIWPSGRNITLVRPLVHQNRENLRACLNQQDLSWIDDPSNDQSAFERIRVRKFLKRHPRLRQMAETFIQGLQAERIGEDHNLARCLEKVAVTDSGLIEVGEPLTHNLLILLARCASGGDADPRASAVAQMVARLNAAGMRQTLGGAWFQKTRTGYLIGRDPAMPHSKSNADTFDGRYVRDLCAHLPAREDMGYLVRQTAPPGHNWREIISERIAHLRHCYQTPLLKPVQT